ncbi:hypothetical protein [Roseovarius sp. EL26]|uniref:hypothetical protein n=1 Tax=Roseovarius sp. EL26 TaxID=2126672 RepID=UPI000EA1D091|nr:hypothetical protein [Roseovarius sp. EL26]
MKDLLKSLANRKVKSYNELPRWQLNLIVILCFPIMVCCGLFVPIAIEAMGIVNQYPPQDVADYGVLFALIAVFLGVGLVALPFATISAAAFGVLVQRVISGDDH